MPRLPTVAIVGRPNSGKSTLFNKLLGQRKAIESPVAGTTRDAVASRVSTDAMDFLLLDTGGIGGGSTDTDLEDDVSAQSLLALEAADLILLTIDASTELTSSDRTVVDLLRKRTKRHIPIVIVLTKADRQKDIDEMLPTYHSLGIGELIFPVSAAHNQGMDELLETVEQELMRLHFGKQPTEGADESQAPRIAIIGKPNVGKSSIINALMPEPQRKTAPRLVSDIPGTTRDASDTVIRWQEREYVFVDTAGLRRRARVTEDLEHLSAIKSIQSLQQADIVVLVLDATETVSRQDKRIVEMAMEEGKGIIFLLNKADLLKREEKAEKDVEVQGGFPFCHYAPRLFVSAKTKDGLLKLFPLIETVSRNRTRHIPIKDLRRWYEDSVERLPASAVSRSKYITQAKDVPPTFVLFTRHPELAARNHMKYLENSLRQTFAFEGTPIRWITKQG